MAAGLGFKTFTTGEVLTAANVNGYLMQGVLVFASTAARDAAITAPAEGQFAFTKDTDSLWYYNGTAWVASGATGDIEGVTAGTGISGGGTSGTVTVTNSMATAIDAKGDLVVGTGADAFSRLAVGTNTYILTADSAEATGLKWAAPSGGSSGLTLITTSSFSATSSHSVNNVFSSTYDNYLFKFNNCTIASGDYIGMRMRVGGADYSATDYRRQAFEGSGTTGTFSRTQNLTSFTYVVYVDPTYQNISHFELQNPFNTKPTVGFNATAALSAGVIEGYQNWWGLNTTTSYTGFTLVSGANFTGSVSVYGYAK
jgi:hypothetical protein